MLLFKNILGQRVEFTTEMRFYFSTYRRCEYFLFLCFVHSSFTVQCERSRTDAETAYFFTLNMVGLDGGYRQLRGVTLNICVYYVNKLDNEFGLRATCYESN